MNDVVIINAVRTPIGRRGKGLATVHSADLLATVQRAALDRAGVDPTDVDQVIAGCVTQVGMQALNVGRTAWLSAGLPIETAATTIDSQCGSSQQAVSLAAGLLMAGTVEMTVACGVESMSGVPQGANVEGGFDSVFPSSYSERFAWATQFEVVEHIADKWGLSRDDTDRLGVESQQRAALAVEQGRFDAQIVPVTVIDPHGDVERVVDRDEGLRPTTQESLARLDPILPGGRHTAGTSSQISDGAAAIVLTTGAHATALGLRPRARVVDTCLVGSDPALMLTGPIPATQRLLERNSMTIDDFDVIEINEAFASVVLAWEREFEPAHDRVNPNGGAIALGHPVGATGSILVTKALHELERVDGELALITMCCGGGLGTGTIIERL